MAASEISENPTINVREIDETTEVKENCLLKIKLADMKVTDLKAELEKRNVDKSGVKSILIEKLKNALLEEGADPDEFYFSSVSDSVKSKSYLKKKKIPYFETNGKLDESEETVQVSSCGLKDESDAEEHNADDKMSNEVTLQLSIDEEEAQLNEDESMIEIGKSLDEIDSKSVHELNLPISEVSERICSTPEPTTPIKSSTPNKEDVKERKIIKTPPNTKSIESSLSPKVTKVIGKNDKIKNANVLAKSLWVKALSTTTRAADLKTLFSKQGRVLSVKIVKSTKQTPGKCYGFVTMATSADATKAIQNLHHTELNGHTISVERTQSEPSALLKKSESKVLTSSSKKPTAKKESVKKTETTKPVSSIQNKVKSVKVKSSEEPSKVKEDKNKTQKSRSKERDPKSQKLKDRNSKRLSIHKPPVSRSRPFAFSERPYTAFRKPYLGRTGFSSPNIRSRSDLSVYEKMREDRFRQRERFRERERREAEMRRAVEISRHKYIERKQREEAFRLEREKEKLRIEREILERERADILKLERDRQILERERLERERDELRRQAELRQSGKRPFARVAREPEPFWDVRKKPREERSSFYSHKPRLEEPSTSRYEFAPRERSSLGRPDLDRHAVPLPRPEFSDRQPRREVTMRSREERRVFERSNFRDQEDRSSFSSRERTLARRESPRVAWKQDRRVQERVVASRSSSRAQRRMTYY